MSLRPADQMPALAVTRRNVPRPSQNYVDQLVGYSYAVAYWRDLCPSLPRIFEIYRKKVGVS